jgi:hypothetical protein
VTSPLSSGTSACPRSKGGIDETSPDLDPSDKPSAPRRCRTVRYSDRFGEQVRELGGIEAEAALIANLGPSTGGRRQ